MKRYEVVFHAIIEAPDLRTALQTASRVEDAVAFDNILMDTGDCVKEFDFVDCDEVFEDDE